MKSLSIELQIIKQALLGICLICLLAGSVADWFVVSWLEKEHDKNLLAKARVLVTLTKDLIEEVEFDFADEFMPEFESQDSPEYYQLWKSGGDVMEVSNSLAVRRSAGDENLPRMALTDLGHGFDNVRLLDGRDGRMVQIVFFPQIVNKALRTSENISKQKKVTLVVAKERETLDQLIFTVHAALIGSLLLVIVLIASLIWSSVRRGLKPLTDIQQQITVLGASNLEERLFLENAPQELESVIEQFNRLMERLEESFQREQRFTADVAHELRTPISEIRNMAEVALKWPDNARDNNAFYTDVLEASLQMQQIVNNLMALARCDKGQVVLDLKEVDLVNEMESTLFRYQEEANKKQVQFTRQFPDDVIFETSQTEFDLILNNLISNAIEYSPHNCVINARIIKEGNEISISVSNTAEDLAPDDLKNIFDRLWRKDKARSSEQHAGLGLALVKAYTELLGLSVSVELSENSQFTITISSIAPNNSTSQH